MRWMIMITIIILASSTVLGEQRQYIDDEKVYLSAPHTIRHGGHYVFGFMTKNWSGDANIGLLINTDAIRVSEPSLITYSTGDVEHNLTCEGTNTTYGYELNPHYAWCYFNDELLWNQSFDRGNIETKTIYWNETETITTITNINNDYFNTRDIDLLGYNKIYYHSGVRLNAGEMRRIRLKFDIPINTQAKYDLIAYPSAYGTDVRRAHEDGVLYRLDPYINATNNTIAYYSFDEGSGTTINDSTDNAFHGSCSAAMWTDTPTAVAFNSGINFTKTEYCNLSMTDQRLNSTSFWMTPQIDIDAATDRELVFISMGNSKYISLGSETSAVVGEVFLIRANNNARWYWKNEFTAKQKYFIVIQKEGDGFDLYVDTVKQTRYLSGTPDYLQIDDMRIGYGTDHGTNLVLDEVAFYNRSLSSGDMETIYNNGTGLQYPFDNVSADSTAPVISDVTNTTTNETAQINWSTDENANSSVTYSQSGNRVGTVSYIPTDKTSHTINLTGLDDGTTYVYNITSCDATDNCNTTGEYSFTTIDSTAPTTPTGITCNGGSCNQTFTDATINIECNGSNDTQNDTITYEVMYSNYTVVTQTIDDNNTGIISFATIYYSGFGTDDSKLYIDVNISDVPASSTITDAKLYLYVTEVGDGWDDDVNIYRVTSHWDETSSAGEIENTTKNTFSTQTGVLTTTGYGYINVTDIVKAAYDDGNKNVSIMIEDPDYNVSDANSAQYSATVNNTHKIGEHNFGEGCNNCYIVITSDDNTITGARPYLTITSRKNGTTTTIGNHTEGTPYAWDVTSLSGTTINQLMCRAKDINGSDMWSTNYTQQSNMTLDYTPIGGGTNCTCSGLNNNKLYNLSDNCVINNNCDMGTGNITWTGTGGWTLNATLTCKETQGIPAGETLTITSNGVWNIG